MGRFRVRRSRFRVKNIRIDALTAFDILKH
jgi:hypothetical protein